MNQAAKKVLYIITKATWGGAQRYVYDLSTHLPARSYAPAVAFGTRGRLAKMLDVAGVESRHIRSLGRDVAIFSDMASFVHIIREIRRTRPDVVHLNSSKAAGLGALAARLCGVKRIVFTVHGWPFNESRNPIARSVVYAASWLTAILSDAVIVVSRSDEAQSKRMPFVHARTTYIPIGIEAPHFLSSEEAVASLSINSATPRIVTIAELTKNKGIRYAIEAVAMLKKSGIDLSYSVIGDGEDRVALEKLAHDIDVSDRVHFLGFMPDAANYLKAFDIFLLPSIKEGMPYVLLEATEARLPIVTTSVVNPEVVERCANIRAVSPANPKAIARALTDTIRAREENELFPAEAHFPLADMVRKTVALYLPAQAG